MKKALLEGQVVGVKRPGERRHKCGELSEKQRLLGRAAADYLEAAPRYVAEEHYFILVRIEAGSLKVDQCPLGNT